MANNNNKFITYKELKKILCKCCGDSFFSGASIPDADSGSNDEHYFNTVTGELYKKISGTWTVIYTFAGGGTGAISVVTDNFDGTYNHDDGNGTVVVIDTNTAVPTFTFTNGVELISPDTYGLGGSLIQNTAIDSTGFTFSITNANLVNFINSFMNLQVVNDMTISAADGFISMTTGTGGGRILINPTVGNLELITGANLIINDGSGLGTATQVLTSDGSVATWEDVSTGEEYHRAVINQVGHGFTLPTEGFIAVTLNGSTWAAANTSTDSDLQEAYIVEIIDTDNFIIQQSGYHNAPSHGLTVGEYYFLQDAGGIATTSGTIDSVVGVVIDANTIQLIDNRPVDSSLPLVADNIYNANGVLTANRTVGLGGFNLTFNGGASEDFTINNAQNFSVFATGTVTIDSSTGNYTLTTAPAIDNAITSILGRDVSGALRLLDKSTLGVNLFTSDLTLTANRSHDLDGNQFTFFGGLAFNIQSDDISIQSSTGTSSIKITGTNQNDIEITATDKLQIEDSTGSTGAATEVLTSDGAGNSTWQAAGGSNLYTADGSLTGNRLIDLSTFSLGSSGTGEIEFTTVPGAATNLRGYITVSDDLLDLFALTTFNLYGAGIVAENIATGTFSTIYAGDASNLGGDADSVFAGTTNFVTGAQFGLNVEHNAEEVRLLLRNGTTVDKRIRVTDSGIGIEDSNGTNYELPWGDGNSGDVLITNGLGNVTWQTIGANNIYSDDGTLLGDRMLDGGTFNLSFLNLNEFILGGNSINISSNVNTDILGLDTLVQGDNSLIIKGLNGVLIESVSQAITLDSISNGNNNIFINSGLNTTLDNPNGSISLLAGIELNVTIAGSNGLVGEVLIADGTNKMDFGKIDSGSTIGASGSFTAGVNTITVTNGLITSIV